MSKYPISREIASDIHLTKCDICGGVQFREELWVVAERLSNAYICTKCGNVYCHVTDKVATRESSLAILNKKLMRFKRSNGLIQSDNV